MKNINRRFWLLAFAASFAMLMSPLGAVAQTVTIIVNGGTVTFDQPPIERAGRVFVPLRGVFERLGASVVYANGLINATGNGRNISLHIGSMAATVNGQAVTIDVAPFLVGARTLVPLRFVAQSLGATVDYNGSNRTVTINSGGGGTAPPPATAFGLLARIPDANSTTGAIQPGISARFGESVDVNSLHVYLDGRDVTTASYANAGGFEFTPQYSVPAGTHTVRVTGTTASGVSFDRGWSFRSTAGLTNFINALTPAPGSNVSSSFALSGRTRAGSSVTITATGQALLGHVFTIGTGTFRNQTTADGTGYFSLQVNVQTVPGGNVQVLITSLGPDGASTSRTVNYPT